MLDDYKNPSFFAPDFDYFKTYPAPMFEAVFNQHIGPCNSTTPYFGPLLYWLCRCVNALNVMEIGLAQGWSSFFMASAVKDAGVRNGVEGTYYGVDIADKKELFDEMNARGVNAKFIHSDSLKWLETQTEIEKNKLELVFIDGWHETEHVKREVELIYPLLKDKGDGYLILHDVSAWCEEVYPIILNDPKYKWESIRFLMNYGLAIMRKMENFPYDKIFWPDGCQHEQGVL